MSYGQGGGRGYGSRHGNYGVFGPRSFAPKPVKVGEEYDVEITEISRRGDGIAKIQGFIIFVNGAKAGQKAKIKVTNVSNRYATAEMVSSSEAEAAPDTTSEEPGTEA
ncbi:MAG: TRAM domain-containing protein [Nitrososphaerota archaeon]|nr:TRAM domain-containing protein [Nitrososphaerota archaeon]MDG6939091.1 TRAM domain-containing protein [Nitrososphaerota archaeon]